MVTFLTNEDLARMYEDMPKKLSDLENDLDLSSGDGKAIIDCTALPTENISEGVFYRLLTAKFMDGLVDMSDYNFLCKCVRDLPEIGEVITDEDMTYVNVYYNIQDKKAYGYMNEELASLFGASEGWYDFGMLASITDSDFGGVITDISQIPKDDNVIRVLVRYNLYTYNNGWKEIPYAEESEPEFLIEWDGVIGDRFYLDLSALGKEGMQLVKVSDEVYTVDQLLGSRLYDNCRNFYVLEESDIDTEVYAGAITIRNGETVVVYSASDTNAALGLPDGYITNGIYFLHIDEIDLEDYYQDELAVLKLVGKRNVTKIDEKFLPAVDSKNIPTPEYYDEGRFLQVVNGSPTWVSISSAEGGSF